MSLLLRNTVICCCVFNLSWLRHVRHYALSGIGLLVTFSIQRLQTFLLLSLFTFIYTSYSPEMVASKKEIHKFKNTQWSKAKAETNNMHYRLFYNVFKKFFFEYFLPPWFYRKLRECWCILVHVHRSSSSYCGYRFCY